MATKTQPAVTTDRTTTTGTKRNTTIISEPLGNQTFMFDSSNYKWMIGGVALIILGFILMSGGKSPDPHQFNYDEIYSFRRITLAPILVLLGFAVEIYAIMKKPAQA